MRAGQWLAMAGLFFSAIQSTPAQGKAGSAPDRPRPIKERVLPSAYPDKPSVPPSWTIPVEPLGFSPPGPLYLGQRNSLVSLDFIDENRLLFTFRVPGLIHRELKAGETGEGDERKIRAVVLTFPDGNVEAEGLWTLHDRARYLWMLKDGHFLLRDENNLQQGDAHLVLKPLLQFPGTLLGLELDPSQQYLVSNSLEPVSAPSKPSQVASPATAAATVTQDSQSSSSDSSGEPGSDTAPAAPDTVVRILRRESGQVMLVSRVRASVHLPINSEGYLETLRGRGEDWVLNLNFFTGGSRILGSVGSTCLPTITFISQQVVLAIGCDGSGARKLVAITTDGRALWDDLNPDTSIWPITSPSPDGLRLMLETLAVTHPVSAYAPLGSDDVKGQLIRVFDAATGEVAFESPASPTLDAGGNAAISPSGRRVAVLNAGAIQVFELPAPLPLPNAGSKQPAH
jgi:hypothetical protein